MPEEMAEFPIDAYDNYTETGGLNAIKKHDLLRAATRNNLGTEKHASE